MIVTDHLLCLRADTVPARNDFVCMIGCVSGRDAVLAQNASVTLNSSYFDPPYMVNNGDNLYNISYKTVAVTASHYDGTLVRIKPLTLKPQKPSQERRICSLRSGALSVFCCLFLLALNPQDCGCCWTPTLVAARTTFLM